MDEIILKKKGLEVSIENTHLEGYLHEKFDEVVRLFGIPHFSSEDRKCLAHWNLLFEFQGREFPITIYDFKSSFYYSPEGLNLSEIDDWHIGAKDNTDYHLFIEYVKQQYNKNKKDKIRVLTDQINDYKKGITVLEKRIEKIVKSD